MLDDLHNHDEDYHGLHRKESRKERKRLSTKDRSKFKKTDKRKYEEGIKQEYQSKLSKRNVVRGRVLSITSQGVIVDVDGRCLICSLRGLLKREFNQVKNIVTVGDFVSIEEGSDQEGVISDVEKRKSVLSRADSLSRRKEQLIAANIDQVLITMSVVSPQLKLSLIDRYIIATLKGNMEPVVVVNKIDLLADDEGEKAILQKCVEAYAKEGIPLLMVSASTGEGLDNLRHIMKDKASVFSGQSGTGKSSLINAVADSDLPVSGMVKKTGKGSHTTTQAHLVPLKFGGWCIDTPGIRSFGVWDLKAEEIKGYFSEINEAGRECKYPDCLHMHEAGCAVLAALETGQLSPFRYESYRSLMETAVEHHKRR